MKIERKWVLLIIAMIIIGLVITLILISIYTPWIRIKVRKAKPDENYKYDPKRFLVYMTYDDGAKEYGDICAEINKMYADRYGLAFQVFNISLPRGVAPHFMRYYVALEQLKSGKYDILLYLDADAMIIDQSYHPKNFIPYENEIVFGNEMRQSQYYDKNALQSAVNSGIISCRRSESVIAFFDYIVNSEPEHNCTIRKYSPGPKSQYHDQECIEEIIKERDILDKYGLKIKFWAGVQSHLEKDSGQSPESSPESSLESRPVYHMIASDNTFRANTAKKMKNILFKNK